MYSYQGMGAGPSNSGLEDWLRYISLSSQFAFKTPEGVVIDAELLRKTSSGNYVYKFFRRDGKVLIEEAWCYGGDFGGRRAAEEDLFKRCRQARDRQNL